MEVSYLADNFKQGKIVLLTNFSYKDIISTFQEHKSFILRLYVLAGLGIIYLLNGGSSISRKHKYKDAKEGPEASGQGEFGTARWAKPKEIETILPIWNANQSNPSISGIPVGFDNKTKKVWISPKNHLLLIGSTGSGKNRRIIFPSIYTIAQHGESMILTDPKGENLAYTRPYLEKLGYDIITINLYNPQQGNLWNMMDPVIRAIKANDIPSATKTAADIANSFVRQNPGAQKSEPIWIQGEIAVLKSAILAVAMEAPYESQKHMGSVYSLIAELGETPEDGTSPINDYFDSLPVDHPARMAFGPAKTAAPKTRASFFATALADLQLFSDPSIRSFTAKQDHDFTQLGHKKTAVFLIIPDESTTRNVLASLYIDQLYTALVESTRQTGGSLPIRVNFILDEFGNLPMIPDFSKKITVARSRKIRFIYALQGLDQLKAIYGYDANNISGNSDWVYLRTADLDTAKIISQKTGTYTISTQSYSASQSSSQHSTNKNSGQSVNLTGRALMTADEIMSLKNKSLVMAPGEHPIKLPLTDLNDWPYINSAFGMKTSEEGNRKLREERESHYKTKPINKVDIWIPEISKPEPETKNNKKLSLF